MLYIVGDINFSDGFFDMGFGVGSSIMKGVNPFENLNFRKEDFWIGNFECVCANVSNKQGTLGKQFRVNPQDLSAVRHLNLYGVANNHVMQHGEDAYQEMLNYIENVGSQYVGSKDKRSIIFEHNSKHIGVIACNQRPENFSENPLYWAIPEYRNIENEIAKLECDFKIAFIHWGNEFINYPYIDQKSFAHYLIDCGIDLIVGMHPHVLQGYEIYKGKYIFYSLGNCVFNMPWTPTKYGAIVNVDDDFKVSYDYIVLDHYFPKYISENDVPKEFRFEYLNELLQLHNEENEQYYHHVFQCMKAYRKANRKDVIRNIYKLSIKDMNSVIFDFIKRRIK